MLRQIITPSESSFTLKFPKEMVGKTVEIIAFEIQDRKSSVVAVSPDKENNLLRIRNLTKDSLIDLTNFKFNRDEANNYHE